MNGNSSSSRAELAADIRRRVGSEATKRLLRTLPAFRLEQDVPRRLQELLDRLDEPEEDATSGEQRQ
jgi:hypothetical protein